MRLAGKSAIITGAGRGIGKATALMFAREGANVLVPDLDLAGSQAVAKEIEALGRKGVPLQMDVTRSADIQRIVETALREFGRIDILVNNAGVTLVRDPMLLSEADWDRTLNLNLKAAFFCAQAVGREMVKQKQGVILNAASISGRAGKPMMADYCASKFGIIAITQSLALAWAKHGIRVNAVAPGIVDTDMWVGVDKEWSALEGQPTGTMKRLRVATIPLGRIETPEDVAKVYTFLASDEAAYITGQTVNVCGGLQLN
ncbi:MAG TPA: glucose 1-dehydrogenase [Candidatus Baltobacteraceae bacterium]|nr:glucose 1-dehydrogenase [Candidatus Baltobacteraceae bacterium]